MIWIWQLGHHEMTRDAPGRLSRSIVLYEMRPVVLASPLILDQLDPAAVLTLAR